MLEEVLGSSAMDRLLLSGYAYGTSYGGKDSNRDVTVFRNLHLKSTSEDMLVVVSECLLRDSSTDIAISVRTGGRWTCVKVLHVDSGQSEADLVSTWTEALAMCANRLPKSENPLAGLLGDRSIEGRTRMVQRLVRMLKASGKDVSEWESAALAEHELLIGAPDLVPDGMREIGSVAHAL